VTIVTRTVVVLAGTIVFTLSGGTSALTANRGSGGDRGGASGTDALTRATAAALAETGGGRVTGTEVGDEESYYEVEVTLVDGRQVDVHLDTSFTVVGSSADIERFG
jgi:hypothetical protein